MSNAVYLISTKFKKKITNCVTWVGLCINWCPLGKGRTPATAEMTATKVTAQMWQENWSHMDRKYVLTIFCAQPIQQYDKNGKRRVVVGQWDLKVK